jgi:hypothetical protein
VIVDGSLGLHAGAPVTVKPAAETPAATGGAGPTE